MIVRCRKKPVVVEAMRLLGSSDGEAARKVAQWCNGRLDGSFEHPRLIIETLEGDMTALAGDYVIKGVQGEFYPVKTEPDIFSRTYEILGEDDPIEFEEADREKLLNLLYWLRYGMHQVYANTARRGRGIGGQAFTAQCHVIDPELSEQEKLDELDRVLHEARQRGLM